MTTAATADPAAETLAAELAKREAALADRERALEAKAVAFAEQGRQARHADHQRAAAELAKKGVVVGPGEQAGLVSFLDGLDAAGTVSFADGGQTVSQAPRDYLLGLLSKMRSRLPPLGEIAGGTGADGINFADAGSIAQAAAAYEAERARQGLPVTPTEAVRHVTRGVRS